MRINANNSLDAASINTSATKNMESVNSVVKQGSKSTSNTTSSQEFLSLEVNEETSLKLNEAVSKMNEMLHINNSSSKFMYHEGLGRYYVTVVDKNTDEIVREIPPRKLLDAFYEMQKMLGMIVDEKI